LRIKEVFAVINKHHGTNFFEFMNKYRFEEATRLLLDERCSDMTVLGILLQASVNSKSAFHRFFYSSCRCFTNGISQTSAT